MIQLNLLPDIKKDFIKAERTKSTVIGISILVTMGALGLTVLLGIVVYGVQPGLIALKQGDIDKKSKQLRSVPDIEKYLTIQNQLEALPELHEGKVVDSRLFAFLKILNPAPPNNVRLSSLNINEEEKSISFTGVAGGFEAFTVFQDTLRNAKLVYKDESGQELKENMFEDNGIVIEEQSLSTSEGEEELSFNLKVTYRDIIFSPSVTDPKVEVPNIQTTQSVTGRPENSTAPLFDENAKPEEQ